MSGPPTKPADAWKAWSVLWRAPQTRKNKTWDDDGTLVLKGTSATLRNDDGKVVGTGTIQISAIELAFDTELKVGGKDVKIQESLSFAAYKSLHDPTVTNSGGAGGSSSPQIIKAPPRQLSHSILPRPKIPRPVTLPGTYPRPPTAPGSYPRPSYVAPLSLLSKKTPAVEGVDRMDIDKQDKGKGTEKVKPQVNAEAGPSGIAKHGTLSSGQKRPRNENEEIVPSAAVRNGSTPVMKDKGIDSMGASVDDSEEEKEEEVTVPAMKVPRLNSVAGGNAGGAGTPVEVTNRRGVDEEEASDVEMGGVEIMGAGVQKEVAHLHAGKDEGKGKQKQLEKTKVSSKFKGLVPSGFAAGGAVAEEVVVERRYYLCQWRNDTTKKQPVWDGDGVLIIDGKVAKLKDKETGKEIARSAWNKSELAPGDKKQIGSKTIEIESILDEHDYENGEVLVRDPPVPAPKPVVSSFYLPMIAPKTVAKFSFSAPGAQGKIPVSRFPVDAEGAIVMTRPSLEHQKRFNKKGLPVVDVVIDPILSSRLRAHQVEGVKFMYECIMGMKNEGQGCILADDMGLGKTIQAITLIYTLIKQSPFFDNGSQSVIDRAVIVCPVTLVKNWKAEIKKWLGNDRLRVFVADGKSPISFFTNSRTYHVLIIGYERLRTVIDEIKSAQPPIGLIICDEGHRLKSAEAKVTKALKLLPTARRIILSGTPMQNDLSELHCVVDFETPILKAREPKASDKERRVGAACNDQLQRVTQTFLLRRTGDVIQKFLPPKLEYTVFIVPTQLELALYAQIIAGTAAKDVLNGSGAQQLSLLMVLRKLCNTPGLLMQQAKEEKGLEILTESVTSLFPAPGTDPADFSLSGKLLVLGSLLKTLHKAKAEKVVVVSNFTATLDIIEKHCKAMKYPFCRLDGKTPSADRVPMVDGFNRGFLTNNFVFLLSSKSGGTGLNIIGASRLVLVDSDWNPSTDAQAMARIHREGQKKPCVIYRFLTAGTMDEKIFQRQVTKLGLSGSLMDTAEGDADAGGKGDAFTVDDLRSIFKLHSGVACQTHDLLGCNCLADDDDGGTAAEGNKNCGAGSDSDSDSEEEEPVRERKGFAQASQYHREESPPVNAAKTRKNLSILKSWLHHDCLSEESIDRIQDYTLRSLCYERVNETANSSEEGVPLPGKPRILLKGGRIAFAFEKKSSAVGREEEKDALGAGLGAQT